MEFEITNEVPKALSNYVYASGATQKLWFMKLLTAWKRANPTPTSAEAVAVFFIETLQGRSNFQGLLRFYQLSRSTVSAVQPVPVPVPSGKLETRKLEADALAGKLMKRELEAHAPVGKHKKKLEAHVPATKLNP